MTSPPALSFIGNNAALPIKDSLNDTSKENLSQRVQEFSVSKIQRFVFLMEMKISTYGKEE